MTVRPGKEAGVLLEIVNIIAVVAGAMTAALAAGRRSMDWFGVCVLGTVTALGGGTARDLLLNHHPVAWVADPLLLVVAIVAAGATIALARYMARLQGVFLVLDAVGLVVFTILGCNVALGMGLPFIIVVAAGLITGCVGGVMRDVLCNDIPLLFRSELYATVSLVTGVIYVAGLNVQMPPEVMAAFAMIAGMALRLLAIRFQWNMPKFIYTDRSE